MKREKCPICDLIKIDTEEAIQFLNNSKEYLNIVNNYESGLNDNIDQVIKLIKQMNGELQPYKNIIASLKIVWGELK